MGKKYNTMKLVFAESKYIAKEGWNKFYGIIINNQIINLNFVPPLNRMKLYISSKLKGFDITTTHYDLLINYTVSDTKITSLNYDTRKLCGLSWVYLIKKYPVNPGAYK